MNKNNLMLRIAISIICYAGGSTIAEIYVPSQWRYLVGYIVGVVVATYIEATKNE